MQIEPMKPSILQMVWLRPISGLLRIGESISFCYTRTVNWRKIHRYAVLCRFVLNIADTFGLSVTQDTRGKL